MFVDYGLKTGVAGGGIACFRGGWVSAVVGIAIGVVAVVVGPAGRWRGVGLVVEFPECCGVVGCGVNICLLQGRGVEVGALIR